MATSGIQFSHPLGMGGEQEQDRNDNESGFLTERDDGQKLAAAAAALSLHTDHIKKIFYWSE